MTLFAPPTCRAGRPRRLAVWSGLLALLACTAAQAEFNNLTATPNSVFVNSPATVSFVADLKPNTTLNRSSVRLLRENAGTWTVVATMRDDGQGGDAVANDNKFTALYNVPASGAGTLNFRATAAYAGQVQRVQSSVFALPVLQPLSLDIEAGQQNITLGVGESVSTSFTLQVANQAGGASNVVATQTVTPNNSGLAIVTDLAPGGYATNQVNQTFLVQNKFTGNQPGNYTVTLSGNLTAGGSTAQDAASIQITVIPASGIGALTLAAYPGGLQSGFTGSVTFGAQYTVGGTLPTAVQLVEVNAQGTPLQTLTSMLDDGLQPDLSASDRLYTAAPSLTGGAPGTVRYFQAVASFPGGGTASSPTVALQSLPYSIGFAPIDPAAVIADPSSGTQVVCNQLLVAFKPGAPLPGIQAVAASIGASILGVEPALNTYQFGIACTTIAGLTGAIEALLTHPLVEAAMPNGISEVSEFTPNDPRYGSQYAPKLARLDEAWLIARGAGVVVAVLDTGVQANHEDLVGRVILGKDYVNNDANPDDDHSHGTHVAGIVAAAGHNGKGIAGAAWQARILSIKVCGGRAGVPGVGKVTGCPDSAVTSGILEAASKAKIINMSLGGFKSFGEKLLNFFGLKTAREKAVIAAKAAGLVVVAASGNNNTSTPALPCAYGGVFCVGNSTLSDTRYADPTFGSNYGPHVDIAAPGTGILSTVPAFSDPSGYGLKTGTSMASPFVAGVAALVAAANPSWTAAQIEERLLKTAVPLPGQQIGPRVDAFDAVFNGSFEHDLSGWKSSGTVSAVSNLGSINPTKDKRMGMASTGPDSVVSASELYQTFTIQPDVTEIAVSFSYAMITEEYPEWINRGFNDDLRITLEGPGGVTEVALATVDGSAFTAIGGINFPGGDSTVGWTGWLNVTSKKVPVAPGGGTYRLRVRDRGDGIYDTNGVVDNIRFR